MEKLNQDSPLHLADALADEIARTPAQTLLGEVAEDVGDRRALAGEFDAVVARALHQSRRKALTAAVKNAAAWLSHSLFGKPAMLRVGTLVTVAVAAAVGGFYYHDARRAGFPAAALNPPPAAPRQPGIARPFPAYTNDDSAGSQAPAAAGLPAAQMPLPSPPAQSDLQKAETAYDMARTYEARARATEALDRGDYATAVASLTEALRSCADRCQPDERAALDSRLKQAQSVLNTSTAVAVAAAPQPVANPAVKVAAAKSPPALAWPARGRIAVNFGARTVAVADAQSPTTQGITIAVPESAEVRAAADGIVSYVGSDKGPGKFVLIRHDGDLQTGYGHLRRVMVKTSDQVHRGEIIAKGLEKKAGAQPGLYFEVRQGAVAADPLRYLPEDQKQQKTRNKRQ